MTTQTTSTGRVAALHFLLEALAGCAAGLLCGAVFGWVAARLFMGTSGGWGDLVGAVMGALLGYAVGASVGVWAAGRRIHGRGNYWLSLAGSIFGLVAVMLLAEPLRLNVIPLLFQTAMVVVTPVAAALTFHMGPRR